MRTFTKVLAVTGLAILLSACLSGLLVNAGTQIVLAILKPMVGLDPNSHGLFQQPVIKERMQGFLGDKYQPVMQLLATANTLQEEGPLFYVVSRYTPVPQLAEKAGFVWNSDTNQMAVMLISGGSPTVLAEKVLVTQANKNIAEAVPQWPSELQVFLDQDALKKKASDTAAQAVAGAINDAIEPPVKKTAAQEAAEQQLQEEMKTQESLKNQETAPSP